MQCPDASLCAGMAEGGEEKQRCPLCPFASDSIDEMNKHVALHQAAQQQQQAAAAAAAAVAAACGMCTEAGKEPASVTLYGCGVCAKAFAIKEELDEHMQSHASRLFSCAVCGAIFVDKEHLEGHMRTHAPPEVFSYGGSGKPLACSSACPGDGGPRGKKRPFVCPTCGKAFRRKEHVERHLKMHTGERNFGCATCGKSFSQKVHLENHVRIHTGERPFSCHVCGKAFRRKEHIGRHMKTHTGERPFCCSVCAKPFGQRAHLLNHLTIHSGERPFSCAMCQRTFRLREHAERHARTHAPPTGGCCLPPPTQTHTQTTARRPPKRPSTSLMHATNPSPPGQVTLRCHRCSLGEGAPPPAPLTPPSPLQTSWRPRRWCGCTRRRRWAPPHTAAPCVPLPPPR